MTRGGRFLMVVTKNNSSVVLEFPDFGTMESSQSTAESNGAVCKLISMDTFYPTYRGHRYFDLRNPATLKTFSVNEIIKILDAPLEDHKDAEDFFGGNFFH